MVVDNVSADKMDNIGVPVRIHPVLLPVDPVLVRPLLGERDVADRRVHPDVDDQILVIRKPNAPLEISGDAPVIQLPVDPSHRIIPCV